MTKDIMLMQEVVCKYHPLFRRYPELRKYAIKYAHIYKVEHLVEVTMAAVGKYSHTNKAHEDFSDGTDSKTSTVNRNEKQGQIKNVTTTGGFQKRGALRVVIYNAVTETVLYYFIPKRLWLKWVTVGKNGIGSVGYSYNVKKKSIVKFDKHNLQCKSFLELTRRKA
jgi:hypothetical protein